MSMKRFTLFFMCLFLSIGAVMAQQKIVSGVVISAEDNQPVIGASVVAKGFSGVGAQTDIDGKFSFTAPAGAKTIVVTSIGFETQELAIANNMRIVLKPQAVAFDEVIVVAFGTAKKSSFTGATASVDKKKIEKMQVSDAAKALEGVVPGLQISNSSGAPGMGSTMRVRGVGSINASNAPLIILDGAPYAGNINSINPRDIENLNVLKDAASAALYGARGANGVIIITTKNGRKGQVSVNFDARLGVNQRGIPEYDILTNPADFYTKYWEAMRNSYHYRAEKPMTYEAAGAEASAKLIERLGYNIYNVPYNQVVTPDGKFNPNAKLKYEDGDFNDWGALLLKPQTRQEYNLSLTRGVDKSSTFFSIGYLSDKGYGRNTNFDRITSRLSYNTEIYDWLKINASSQLAYTTGNFGTTGSAFSNIFFFTRSIAPIYPVYLHDADGKIILDKDGNKVYDVGNPRKGINGARNFSANKNIVGETDLNKDEYKRLYLTQNIRFDLDLTRGFKFNTTFAHNYINNNTSRFRNPIMGDGNQYGGILTKRIGETQMINWSQVLTWDGKFGDVSLQAMVGHESYSDTYRSLEGEKKKTLDPFSTEFNTYAQITDLNSGSNTYTVEGYFGQITGDYKNKYYLSASLRRDASSVFSRDNRWGTFWSLGASWLISKEEFMKDVKWVNNLKLRSSVGQQGNDNLLDPDGYRMYTPYTNLYSVGSDGTNYSFGAAYKGNPDITWEKNLNFSAGLEFSLFGRVLTGEFDFFQRKTTDMLFNEPVSKTSGFTYEPRNLGSMRNTGFEFSLNANVYNSKNVNLSIGLNGTSYKNKVLELPERFKEEGLSDGNRIIKEGGGINDLYLVKYVGVNPENGDAQYEIWNKKEKKFEVKGSKEYSSVIANRQFIGSAIPKLEGGFNINLSAYSFDFSTQFSYRIGGKIFDSGYSNLMHSGSTQTASNWHKDILNSWSKDNTNTNIPRVELDNQELISTSDMFITNASFLALRNLTLGYTLPNNWSMKAGMKSVRLYVAADNLFLMSKRKGLDPRSSLVGTSAGNVASAIRTISGGLTISL
ncbi:SusC/RagA family TonB-linked outer membrane protein [Porphyromonas macacae]|uniref:SusC/RagA family TonB-linked outer membrane protein n=1 Tax=Porphyromonas macacae TaxID=28115 RepID=UPI0009E002A5|nr:SusC/RagA family TonB-linked outer membrane protein [Porphyromonas macacae]